MSGLTRDKKLLPVGVWLLRMKLTDGLDLCWYLIERTATTERFLIHTDTGEGDTGGVVHGWPDNPDYGWRRVPDKLANSTYMLQRHLPKEHHQWNTHIAPQLWDKLVDTGEGPLPCTS